MAKRLGRGEKRNCKRVAQVAAVFTIAPFMRKPVERCSHATKPAFQGTKRFAPTRSSTLQMPGDCFSLRHQIRIATRRRRYSRQEAQVAHHRGWVIQFFI